MLLALECIRTHTISGSVNIVHKFGDIFFQGLLYRKRYKVVMILHRYTAVSRKQQSFAAVYLYFHLYTW